MTLTKGRIAREGVISFHDASLTVWEEGLHPSMTFKERDAWELTFKRQVFTRIIQTLNRIGWTVGPWDDADRYKCLALQHRTCSKGGLQGELSVSGRCIEFKMWQDVTKSVNPSGGRYDFDKEDKMPYVPRLEVERARRRIRDYLLNVFTGYTFCPRRRDLDYKPLHHTAVQRMVDHFAENPHFNEEPDTYNRKSADGAMLANGMRVFYFDRKGRIGAGTAHYDGGMWRVITGRWDYTRENNTSLYASVPAQPRAKRNASLRRKRLEQEIAKAVSSMNYERAAVLRDVLFPAGEQLFFIKVKKDGLLFGPQYSGYTHDTVRAGRYTLAEIHRYMGGGLELPDLKAVEIGA